MYEKFTIVDFSYHCQQKYCIFTNPRGISNPINIKTNNKIASTLIKKLNQNQNAFVES